MNKKTKTKILTLSAVSALSLAAIWVLASNPNDLLFKWAVKQDAHLELSGVTLIAPTQSSNFDVSFKMSWDQLITLTGTNTAGNSVQGNGTLSFWGSNNKTSDPESLILGGSSNEIANTAKENIIGASQWVKTAGESTTNYGKGNVILASSRVNLTGNSNILRAGNNTKIHGNDNLTFATDKVNITANNSIAIGSWIQIDHDGSFVFNGTSKWETTRKANTAIIKASNGMIINANTKTADNTDLTINGSLQVGNSQIDTAGAIIYNDNCLQLKNTKLGRIGLNCPNATNTDGPFLSFGEVACGRNAGDYGYNEIQWHSGKKDSDFCSKGRLDGEAPKFFDSEDRAAAYKTRGGSYASEWFGYTFHICFNEQDPTCALPKLKKSWTCSDSNGNRLHCQATQDLGKKDPKQTPITCPSGQHLENGKCISNTKTVNCDETGINTANGSVNTSQVAITRSESTKSWSKPAKCDFTCNTGYRKDDSSLNNIHCAKLTCSENQILINNACKEKPLTMKFEDIIFDTNFSYKIPWYSRIITDEYFTKKYDDGNNDGRKYGLLDSWKRFHKKNTSYHNGKNIAIIKNLTVNQSKNYLVAWWADNYIEVYIDGKLIGKSKRKWREEDSVGRSWNVYGIDTTQSANWMARSLKPVYLEKGIHTIVLVMLWDPSGLSSENDVAWAEIYNSVNTIDEFINSIRQDGKPSTIFSTKDLKIEQGLLCNSGFVKYDPNNITHPLSCTNQNPYG